MAEESARIIDAKFTESKKRRGFKFYFIWTLIILVILAVLGTFAFNTLQTDLRREYTPARIKAGVDADKAKAAKMTLPVQTNTPVPTVATEQKPEDLNAVKTGLSDLEARLKKLEQRDNDLTLYLAVVDLKNSLNDPDEFKLALEQAQSAAEDVPEFSGRLDILQQSVDSGLVTTQKLADDLEKLKVTLKNSSRSFGENVRNIFGDLVRVTKVSGEVDKGDYDSIIKRAELKLAKGNLTIADVDSIIKEIQNIGKPADDFVREANNYKRVLEETNSLLASSKERLAE